MTEEQILFEKLVCSKCDDDITKNYIHCDTCKGFECFKLGKAEATKELQEELTKKDKVIEELTQIHFSDTEGLEKQIQIDAEQIRALQKQNGELTDKVDELKKRNGELAGQKASLERWLGEAKEIIRELLSSCFGYNSKTVNYEVKAKAEAFLKNEVTK